ncbi:MAG: DUF4263 domain-containing protein [Proteobacteria bacterium]|nr:DUF4263 domain-containing protein [Pseudomonadota bacterium]
MPIEFKLKERPAGISLSFAVKEELVKVMTTELIGPLDSNLLVTRLEQMNTMVFEQIPNLPSPSLIDNLLILINYDLSSIAYINELEIKARIKINRDVEKGEPIYQKDIDDIDSVDLGVEIPESVGVIVVRSLGWKKSLFYDFGPLHSDKEPRSFLIDQVLAKQALLLLGMESLVYDPDEIRAGEDKVTIMSDGFKRLNQYIESKCSEESKYQELLHEHPWMLGGHYKTIDRHTNLDDENIPDFTAVRCHDNFRDIIEIKQPFLSCFKKKDNFSSSFNDAWNQAERYLSFVHRQRNYLNDEKGLSFENPKCILILGNNLTQNQLKMIREKESVTKSVVVYTYDHIQRTACHILNLVASSREKMANKSLQPIAESDG